MFLNWFGKPSLYLPFSMIIWGMISVLTGLLSYHLITPNPDVSAII